MRPICSYTPLLHGAVVHENDTHRIWDVCREEGACLGGEGFRSLLMPGRERRGYSLSYSLYLVYTSFYTLSAVDTLG